MIGLKKYLITALTMFCIVNNSIGQTEHVYHFPSDTAAINKSLPDYIDLADGKKVQGKITKVDLIKKYVSDKITGTISSGGTAYDFKDISGYQYQGVYFSRADSKKHMIVRMKHGKINLYKEPMDAEKTNDRGVVEFQWIHTRHLIQKGEDGDIKIFSYKLLEKYVSDYQPAADILKYCSSNKKTWQGCEDLMEKAIDIYNSRE
jgi:hypothetical protein